jgi:hypothetical protein
MPIAIQPITMAANIIHLLHLTTRIKFCIYDVAILIAATPVENQAMAQILTGTTPILLGQVSILQRSTASASGFVIFFTSGKHRHYF